MDLHSHESSDDDSSSSTHQVGLLFGAVAATAFLMLLMLFFFWFLETCTRGSDADDQMSSTTATRDGGLPKSLVEQLPVVPFCNSLPLVEKFGDGCSVCLGQFVNDELVRVLPHCAHVFHVECIDMWLCSHTSCPLCRRSVIPQEEKDPKDSTVIDIVDTAEAENGENSVQTEHHNGAAHLESHQVAVSIECKQ